MIDDYNYFLWGVYETADEEEYLIINWDGICYGGETAEWEEVDQDCVYDECTDSFDVSVTIDEDDIEISQTETNRDEGTLTVAVNDDSVAYTVLADSDRGAYLEGSWSWFENIEADDGEGYEESVCSTWESFIDDGITFGSSGDMEVGD